MYGNILYNNEGLFVVGFPFKFDTTLHFLLNFFRATYFIPMKLIHLLNGPSEFMQEKTMFECNGKRLNGIKDYIFLNSIRRI